MPILLCEVCNTPIEYNSSLGIHCPKCNNPTPTPPEEPSGVEEAAENEYPFPKNATPLQEMHFTDVRKAYVKGYYKCLNEAKAWQSTHNTLEWPSEGLIEKTIDENCGTKDDEDAAIPAFYFRMGIEWLKSIIKK